MSCLVLGGCWSFRNYLITISSHLVLFFSGPRYPGEVHLGSFFNNMFLSLHLPTSHVTLLRTTVLDKPEIYLGKRSTLEELSLHKDAGVFKGNTVELQWLGYLWNPENMFETGVVRANES